MSNAVAVIPARGGSKRIPGKNIKPFHGKPIIAYSIECAVSSGLFDRVIVSTDDDKIAAVAEKYGAEVPFVRPAELADDHSTSIAVVDHCMDFLRQRGQDYEYTCMIYATAPFVRQQYLAEGLARLKDSDAVNAFSAASMPFPVLRTFKINEDGRAEMFWPQYFNTRSQDMEEAYQDAGQFYWTNNRRKRQSDGGVMFSNISIPIVIPRYLVHDIDTPEDWDTAELMFAALKGHNE